MGQKAEIGVAMGLEGTEVAKGASDMILTDDNFCSIVGAIEQGRVIYSGIQKFVSFIMSVHFAEVLQIFLCIVTKFPVMRQPLQILFLILVTDLPPSIALGFEPGEPGIMKKRPRPKTQPVVVTWMWISIVINGMIITICIFCTYTLALYAYSGAFLSDDITDEYRSSCTIWDETGIGSETTLNCETWVACSTTVGNTQPLYNANCASFTNQTQYVGAMKTVADTLIAATTGANGALYQTYGGSQCDVCISEAVRRARTCAFISLVWAEGFRAYCSRSFENPVWSGTFSNPSMNKAVLLAQICLFVALFLPGLNDSVLQLYPLEIHGFGWFLALLGAGSTLIFCEIFKCASKVFLDKTEPMVENHTVNIVASEDEPASPMAQKATE